MDKRTLGYTYVLLSQLFFIAWPIFSTLSFGYYNLPTMLSLWFGTSAIFSFLMILFLKKTKEYSMFKKHWKPIILSTLLNTGSVAMGFYALRLLGPSLNSFLIKIEMVLMVLFGIIFLKEKFNKLEAISSIIIILGIFIISFSTGKLAIIGVLLIILHSIFFVLARYIVKTKLHDISPLFLSHYRASFIAFYIIVFAVSTGQFQPYISKGLIFTTLPSILTVIFGHILVYRAYKLMEISKIELINSLQPILVSIASYLIFRELLTLQQFFGGFFIIGGIVWLIYTSRHV